MIRRYVNKLEEGDSNLEIHIEFDDFLTRFDLNEIISVLDEKVEQLLLENEEFQADVAFGKLLRSGAPLTYFGITSVKQGSITLVVSGYAISRVIEYVLKHFFKGLEPSLSSIEIERFGKAVGNILGEHLADINDYLEKYLDKIRKDKRNPKKITITPENQEKPEPTNFAKA